MGAVVSPSLISATPSSVGGFSTLPAPVWSPSLGRQKGHNSLTMGCTWATQTPAPAPPAALTLASLEWLLSDSHSPLQLQCQSELRIILFTTYRIGRGEHKGHCIYFPYQIVS